MGNEKLSKKAIAGYGAGNLSFALVFQLISACFYFYATAILKLRPDIVGTVVSLSVVFDAVTDPVLGYMSDHTRLARLGRRHAYLIVGAVGIAIANALLWTVNPIDGEGVKIALITLYLFSCKLFLTVYTTPYNALGAELSDDYDERTSVQAVKTGFFVLGFLYPSVAGMALFFQPTPQFPVGQMNPEAYLKMGLLASALSLAAGGLCVAATIKRVPGLKRPPEAKGRFLDMFTGMWKALKNANFMYIAVGYLFINVASAMVGAVGMHVFTYTYRLSGGGIALVFGTLFGVAVISQAVWLAISKRRGKKYAVMASLALCIIASLGFFFAVVLRREALSFYIIMACAVIMGTGVGGCLSLPYAMLSDIVDEDELASGERREGVYYGCITFMYKLSQAVVVFLLGHALTAIGFDADLNVQPDNVSAALGYVLPAGFVISFVPAAVCFAKFKHTRAWVEDIQRRLKERKEGNGIDSGQASSGE